MVASIKLDSHILSYKMKNKDRRRIHPYNITQPRQYDPVLTGVNLHYWLLLNTEIESNHKMSADQNCLYEVIVIGAGVMGSAAAYYLSKQYGNKVLLLERFNFLHENGSSH